MPVTGQKREHAPVRDQVPGDRLRVQQLPVHPRSSLHERIIPEDRTLCRQKCRPRAHELFSAVLDAGTVSVRRSVGVIKQKGQARQIREGDTKTARPRVVDIDPATVAILRAWKRERGSLALQLAQDKALAFGNHEGIFRDPETFSGVFRDTQERCARMLGEDAPPGIRLHDLRHSMATIMIRDRENIKVVSERLGHASVTVTLSVYAHVLPGDQRGRPRPGSRPSWRERKRDCEPALGAARYHAPAARRLSALRRGRDLRRRRAP